MNGAEDNGAEDDGAEDWIRTRDPHLGKALESVHEDRASSLACCSVHLASTSSTASAPVVERSTLRYETAAAKSSSSYSIAGPAGVTMTSVIPMFPTRSK